mgnify:CR=1 FL=1
MRTSFYKRALIFILAIFILLPTLSACVKKITLDDAKNTTGKLFSALSAGDCVAVTKLMHTSSGVNTLSVSSFISEVADVTGGRLSDGVTNIRHAGYQELPYNGGYKFRIRGTLCIGTVANVQFKVTLITDAQGYGIDEIDIGGVDI